MATSDEKWTRVVSRSKDRSEARIQITYNQPPRATNPQPSEGKRWIKQAKADFGSINNDTPCWTSFKCQQVVEKALKALVYTKDSNSIVIREHNLHAIASEACPDNNYLIVRIEELLEILGKYCYFSTRYPDSVPGPKIPHDVYRSKNTERAWELCKEILQAVKDRM